MTFVSKAQSSGWFAVRGLSPWRPDLRCWLVFSKPRRSCGLSRRKGSVVFSPCGYVLFVVNFLLFVFLFSCMFVFLYDLADIASVGSVNRGREPKRCGAEPAAVFRAERWSRLSRGADGRQRRVLRTDQHQVQTIRLGLILVPKVYCFRLLRLPQCQIHCGGV